MFCVPGASLCCLSKVMGYIHRVYELTVNPSYDRIAAACHSGITAQSFERLIGFIFQPPGFSLWGIIGFIL